MIWNNKSKRIFWKTVCSALKPNETMGKLKFINRFFDVPNFSSSKIVRKSQRLILKSLSKIEHTKRIRKIFVQYPIFKNLLTVLYVECRFDICRSRQEHRSEIYMKLLLLEFLVQFVISQLTSSSTD